MDSTSKEQSDVLFQSALRAETSKDWLTLQSICEQGLKIENLEPSKEALFRRLRARALSALAVARREPEAYDLNLLQEASEEARQAVSIYDQLDSPTAPPFVAQTHELYGDIIFALCLNDLTVTPNGSEQINDLLTRAIEQYRKTLQIEPQNKSAREMLGQLEKQLEAIKQPKKQAETKKEGCFIATSAYGSPLAPEITILRRFRDEVLLKSGLGIGFVNFYYVASPPLASFISKRVFLRAATRQILLKPILRFLKATSRFR
jgi:hypothetical protein